MRPFSILLSTLIVVFCFGTAFGQAYKEDIGWNDLVAKYGGALEDGSIIKSSIVEAPLSTGNYHPNTGGAEFTGKTFWNQSGGSSFGSGHATTVSRMLTGNDYSIASGVTDITVYEANDWINRITGLSSGGDPLAQENGIGEAFQVQNHSYIGNGLSAADATNILQRIDFMVNRDNSTITVGTNNSGSTPQLLAPGYNTITVGKSNGTHATGATSFYGAGRTKPEVVAPESFTSFSTPMVGAAASILRHSGAGTDATQNEVVKALLLGGATKEDEFSSWSRTTTQPLDTVYGAGELNIYNSYEMLQAGEQDGSLAEPVDAKELLGWDYGESIDDGDSIFYDFVTAGNIQELSIMLTWNMNIIDTNADANFFTPEMELADLNLALYDSNGGFLDTLIDSSISAVDNVEHIYQTNLTGGRYTLRVTNDSGTPISTDFGLAWQITAIPEPATGTFLVALAITALIRRKKS